MLTVARITILVIVLSVECTTHDVKIPHADDVADIRSEPLIPHMIDAVQLTIFQYRIHSSGLK